MGMIPGVVDEGRMLLQPISSGSFDLLVVISQVNNRE